MHITQRNIIAKLMYSDALRYSDIKPSDMSGNQFAYHLENLIRDDYVKKQKNGHYSLTLRGKQYTDRLSMKTMKRTSQPKIVVMVKMYDHHGKVLFHKRHRQPFSKMWNLPYAKVRFNEHPSDTLLRVVEGRHKLSGVEFHAPHTVSLIVMNSKEEIVTNLLAILFVAKHPLPADFSPKNDHYIISSPTKLDNENTFPGIKKLARLSGPGKLMENFVVEIEDY